MTLVSPPYAPRQCRRFFLSISLLCMCLANTEAQQKTPSGNSSYTGKGSTILDDTTRNIYGPKTTRWISEKDLFDNKVEYKPLDTTIMNYHRWTYVQKSQYAYQDLGNNGTALNLIVPSVVSSFIGATSGFSVYAPYYNSEAPKYFNSKSSYTTFKLVWGGKGRAMSRIEYSRNINPRWNVGFNYRPILTDKQILRRQKGDRQVISHYYDFHTSFFSKNKKYALLAHFRRMRHQVKENGGITLATPSESIAPYYEENATPLISAVTTIGYRRNYHLYHQYELSKKLQIFQSIDFDKETYSFRDNRNSEPYYARAFKETYVVPGLDSVQVDDYVIFNSQSMRAGVKGNISKFFYSAYYKARYYGFSAQYVREYDLPIPQEGLEQSLGGRLDMHLLDSLMNFTGEAELLNSGQYSLSGQLSSPWFVVSAKSVLAKPSFLATNYKGTHNFWIQSLNNTSTNQIEGQLKLKLFNISIFPGASYTVYSNRVYYKSDNPETQSTRAVQSGGVQQLAVGKLRLEIPVSKKFIFGSSADYNTLLQNDDQAIQIPQLLANAQIAYKYYLFKKAIFVHAGFDIHWQSSYYAMQYDPSIQQYYVQKQFKTPPFTMLGAFFNAQFKRGRVFVKYQNILQMALLKQSYYMPTPYYRGIGPIVDFGFDLILFD